MVVLVVCVARGAVLVVLCLGVVFVLGMAFVICSVLVVVPGQATQPNAFQLLNRMAVTKIVFV